MASPPNPTPPTDEPGTGAKIVATLTVGVLAFAILAFVWAFVFGDPPATEPATRIEKIDAQFSNYDGEHTALAQYVKSTMNDPDSYEHVESGWKEDGNDIVVRLVFRGKNAFGGVVKNSIDARVSEDGDLLEILKQ